MVVDLNGSKIGFNLRIERCVNVFKRNIPSISWSPSRRANSASNVYILARVFIDAFNLLALSSSSIVSSSVEWLNRWMFQLDKVLLVQLRFP